MISDRTLRIGSRGSGKSDPAIEESDKEKDQPRYNIEHPVPRVRESREIKLYEDEKYAKNNQCFFHKCNENGEVVPE